MTDDDILDDLDPANWRRIHSPFGAMVTRGAIPTPEDWIPWGSISILLPHA
jgi:hypothetical protein